MLRIGHVPLGIKILVDVWNALLLWEHQDADAAEDGPYVDQSTVSAEATGRCTHEGGDFSAECGESWFICQGTRNPVNRIFKQRRDRTIVFRASQQQAIMLGKKFFQRERIFTVPFVLFEVLIEQW